MTTYQDDDIDFGVGFSEVEDQPDYSPIPAGKYLMICAGVELKDTRNGNGKMVKATFEVYDHLSEFNTRKIFENFNLQHPNLQTVQIAQRQVKQWAMACGADPNARLTMSLLRSLEGQEFLAHVTVQQDKTGQYGPQNRISRYEPLGTSPSPQQRVSEPPRAANNPPPRQAAPRAKTGNKRPWE